MTNTINKAEQAGIYAALLNKHTYIASDNACSLSQIRRQLLFPELQRNHMHTRLLQQIVTLIQASPDPIHFYKVKAHAGIAGNEFADLIAKHAGLHDHDHTVNVQLMATHTQACSSWPQWT
jgi:ribonuclease HI